MPAIVRPRKAVQKKAGTKLSPRHVIAELEKHILVDGFKLVFDLEKSRGSRFVDAATGRELIDLYSFYASQPVGFNHPNFERPEVQADLLAAAKIKVANADVYTVQYATFISTFHRVMGLPPLERYFFIEGGSLAVENALKAAMDWKVRKNLAAGRGERGTEIIHFEQAFHGRTGYTMSLTNTEARKTLYFAKFPWPRITSPSLDFSLPPSDRERTASEKEKLAERQIRDVLAQKGADIAAIIIEPVQGEGGDNHFRGEFLKALRLICDEHDLLLIFDEVQCGMGATGRKWACEHFDVMPDLMAFGKKAQVCGVMAGPRLDEVEDNAFRLPSRLNSTWGGNYTDMVRSTHFLHIIEEEHLVENAGKVGTYFLDQLRVLQNEFDFITAVRGRGMFLAFDLPNATAREDMWKGLFDAGLFALRSGECSIRFRPALDFTAEVVDESIELMRKYCRKK
jgi:L-lysine 6-transaminase